MPVTLNADGFYDVLASADSRVVYVSSTTGNNANPGTEALPLQTIAAGYAMLRSGYPDHLMLRRGDSFAEGTVYWGVSGRSASEPALMGAYGTGARPVWNTAGESSIIFGNVSYVYVQSVEITPGPAGGSGMGRIGACNTITLEDVYLHHAQFNLNFDGDESARPTNIALLRCIVADSAPNPQAGYGSGILTGWVDGFLCDSCYFIGNGWGDGSGIRSIFNHNFYIYGQCDRVTIRNTVVANGSYNGISCNATRSVMQNNLVVGNCVGIMVRQNGSVVEDNVVCECEYQTLDSGANESDSRGINIKRLMGEAIAQQSQHAGAATVRNNLVVGPCVPLDFNAPYFTKSAIVIADRDTWNAACTTEISGNIVYNWEGPCLLVENRAEDTPTAVTGNTFWANNGAYGARPIVRVDSNPSHADCTFSGNHHYRSDAGGNWFGGAWGATTYDSWVATVGETGSTSTAPDFTDPGRTVGQYAASIGLVGTRAAFLAACRAQRRGSWNTALEANEANTYIRDGFAASGPAPAAFALNPEVHEWLS